MSKFLADLENRLEGASESERPGLLLEISTASRRQDPVRAISAAHEAVGLSRRMGDEAIVVSALSALGIARLDTGDCDGAVEVLLDALSLAEGMDDATCLGSVLNRLGLAHFVWENDEKAREFHERARDLAERGGTRQLLAEAHLGLGLVHARIGKEPDALRDLGRSLELGREFADDRIVLSSLNNLGRVHQQVGRHEEALGYFEESLAIKRRVGDRKGEAGAQINIGSSLANLSELDAGCERIREGLRLAEEVDARDFQLAGLMTLSELEERRGDLRAALEAARLLHDLRCRMFTDERARSIAEMRTRYETEHAERESEIRRLENIELTHQLRQAQRMEIIGRLAGGVAHDFNNLLTAIIGYSEILKLGMSDDDPSRRSAEAIREAADRATTLVRQLLAFGRKQVLEPRKIDLNGTISGLEGMLRRLIGEDIDLRTDLLAEAGIVVADPGQMEQVVVNLVVNARDAMPAGGSLTLCTRIVELDEKASRALDLDPGPHVRLAVSDTGLGMDADTAVHVFEPFFTTKAPDKGTGLGLATVHGIIQQSQGSITVSSEPDRGTTFEIHLPFADGPMDAARQEERIADAGGSETILLVEDDEAVRSLSRDLLLSRGYRVTAVGSGEKALEIAARPRMRIDLLLTDVVLPGLSGPELASRLGEFLPGTRVLYMSGHADDAILESGVPRPGAELLSKPFGPRVLARRVREVLDQPRSLDPS